VRPVDNLDALAAIGAFILVLIMLATGRVPRDLELWAYGAGGALLVAGLVVGIRKRKK
jgi:hypothetical protein